jgi:hypothetical protein
MLKRGKFKPRWPEGSKPFSHMSPMEMRKSWRIPSLFLVRADMSIYQRARPGRRQRTSCVKPRTPPSLWRYTRGEQPF